MASQRTPETSAALRLSQAACLGVLPVAMLLLDFQAGLLAACGGYGYGCTEAACFTLEVSTNYGYTWQKGSAWIYGPPGAQIDLFVRATVSFTVDQVDGWSLGVRHSAPTLSYGVNGGDFRLRAAAAGPGLATLQAGAPPDLESTRAYTCGLTQGVVVDMERTSPPIGPAAGIVAVHACYRVTIPYDSVVHDVLLELKDDVGVRPVANVVSRLGQSVKPCLENLTLRVYPSYYLTTPSYCPVSGPDPPSCP